MIEELTEGRLRQALALFDDEPLVRRDAIDPRKAASLSRRRLIEPRTEGGVVSWRLTPEGRRLASEVSASGNGASDEGEKAEAADGLDQTGPVSTDERGWLDELPPVYCGPDRMLEPEIAQLRDRPGLWRLLRTDESSLLRAQAGRSRKRHRDCEFALRTERGKRSESKLYGRYVGKSGEG